jgi:hypothetical protein
MATLGNVLIQFVGERPTPLFLVLLAVHVAAGLTCVVSGAGAAISKKSPGRHPTFGRAYYWALLVVFLSSSVMSVLRWSRDYDLFILGAIAFSAGSTGYSARKIRWRSWPTYHATGMGSSYVVLLTAFYVDNGPHLPLWDHLPTIAFWILPSLVGLPLIALALRRHSYLSAKAKQQLDGD